MEKGEYRVHYHRVRELPEEFLRIKPAMSVVEKAGYGKTKEFSLISFIPYCTFGKISYGGFKTKIPIHSLIITIIGKRRQVLNEEDIMREIHEITASPQRFDSAKYSKYR